MTDKIVVLSSCAVRTEAEALARRLVELRLAACVSVVPGAQSVYRWKGAVETSEECLLLIKSSRERFRELAATLQAAHSYEVPELIALSVVEGSPDYLNWLGASLDREGEEK